MPRQIAVSRPNIGATAVVVAFALAFPSSVGAYAHKTLHSFCAWDNCNDGASPVVGLLLDGNSLYGFTQLRGQYDFGTIFKYDLGTATYSVLHAFQSNVVPNELIVDVDGNLYGTTKYGGGGTGCGSSGCGMIYQLSPGADHWTWTKIYTFPGGNHGGNPHAGLTYAGQAAGAPWDKSSPLFGTAQEGGTHSLGVAYQLTHNGNWVETVIHNFTEPYPNALTMDSAGNLFGTTELGGKYNSGRIFKLTQGTWAYGVLKNFCAKSGCTDGEQPDGRLLIDASGNLFGTTALGGLYTCGQQYACGVAFELPTGGKYRALHRFCSKDSCSDGWLPNGSLIMDSSGYLFGTAEFVNIGGPPYGGVAFQLSNATGKWAETGLYSFCQETDCVDGDAPDTPLVRDSSGNLFGVTFEGGQQGLGTLYELTP